MAADNGISRESEQSSVTLLVVIIFVSLALYNFVELHLIIFTTFKIRRSLYFWSFLVSTWGIAVYAVGFLLKAIQPLYPRLGDLAYLYSTLIVVGWCCMVTGQSVVLYSRLHIIIHDRKYLRAVLIMICVDAVICHAPIAVMVYGANSANPGPWVLPYSVYEKVQVTIFFVQEVVLSGLYISQTTKQMRIEVSIRGRDSERRAVMLHLVCVNLLIVILDITILALEYAGLYDIQTAYKALVYAIKLKLEFSILNRLVELTQARSSRSQSDHTTGDGIYGSSKSRGNGRTTRVERDMPLTTIDREGPGQGTVGGVWEAYVHTGEQDRSKGFGTREDVMKTVEVLVEEDRNSPGSAVGRNTPSLGRKPDLEHQGAVSGGSLTSSEIHFAKY